MSQISRCRPLEPFPPDLNHCDEGILCRGQKGGEERGLATVEPSDAATAQKPPSLRVARPRPSGSLRSLTDAMASLCEPRLPGRLAFGRRSWFKSGGKGSSTHNHKSLVRLTAPNDRWQEAMAQAIFTIVKPSRRRQRSFGAARRVAIPGRPVRCGP